MNFEQILADYRSKACIISVETYPDGSYGNIRIAAGNKAHCDDMMNVMHRPFINDSPYEEYFPQNKNFEDFCYRSAILGQPMHSYVPLPQMGLWLNMFLLPLSSDRENIGYCVYIYDVTPEADSEKRASVSAETSAQVLETCIKLRGARDIRKTLQEVIEDVREICGSDHCCILLTDPEERSCTNLCESLKKGSELRSINGLLKRGGFYEITETWDATLDNSTCIILKDERDMEWLKTVNPVWYESLKGSQVSSIVLFPLQHNGHTMGYLWATNFNVEDTIKIKETLELTSFFISTEISNYQLLQRMEIMSTVDMLTGVRNRNKMNTTVDAIVSGKLSMPLPYAVIFADLNGLKTINDTGGHGAGDQILKAAAMILRDAFPDSDVFRAGGDEFMIIAPGMDEERVKEKCDYIRESAAKVENLFFAIGTHVAHDPEDIRLAMRLADQGMYADKKAYYETHPDRRGR